MLDLRHVTASPYVRLLPSGIVAGLFGGAWLAGHLLILQPLQLRQAQLDTEWAAARQHLAQRLEAKQTIKDLAQLLALLPSPRDFSQLPLALSDEAKRNNVTLAGLSYTMEKADQMPAMKVTLKGPVTGRYEDLRRFIYHLEASDRLLFIEDLDVGQSETSAKDLKRREMMTFTLQLSTYIRQSPGVSPASNRIRQNVRKASDNLAPPQGKTGEERSVPGAKELVLANSRPGGCNKIPGLGGCNR
jgi:Tfp pilus assembly protein PilO